MKKLSSASTEQKTIKVDSALIEWASTKYSNKYYGFVKDVLVFVIRPPVEGDRIVEKCTNVLHDLFHDHPAGFNSVVDAQMEAQKIVMQMWKKKLTMPKLRSIQTSKKSQETIQQLTERYEQELENKPQKSIPMKGK